MAELNDRAREHAEASRLVGAGAIEAPYSVSVTYVNSAGEGVYSFRDYDGHESAFGPTEPLPDVSPNSVVIHGGGSGSSRVSTIIDDWTVSPWAGWRAVFIFTGSLPILQ